jgi:predicted nicotinamide N-methyase
VSDCGSLVITSRQRDDPTETRPSDTPTERKHVATHGYCRCRSFATIMSAVVATTKSYTHVVSADGRTMTVRLHAAHSSRDCFSADQPSTGHAVWFAAENLTQMLVDQVRSPSKSWREARHVLELGAGPGLVGIWAAKLLEDGGSGARDNGNLTPGTEARQYLFTDGDADVVALLQRNCDYNEMPDSVVCAKLWWGSEESSALRSLRPGGFDIILGADLIYGREHTLQQGNVLDNLMSTVQTLLAINGVFYLAFTRRDLPVDVVLACAEKHGMVYELEEDYVFDIFDTNTDGQTCFWRDAIYAFRRTRIAASPLLPAAATPDGAVDRGCGHDGIIP